jgi:hypothetical protein
MAKTDTFKFSPESIASVHTRLEYEQRAGD